MRHVVRNRNGFALVMVLLILAVLIGIVSEFAYNVYHETVSLYRWRDLQRLSVEAESGIAVGERFLKKALALSTFTYPDRIDLPIPDVAGDGRDSMAVSIIDENAKININRMINPNQTENAEIVDSFTRLLSVLDISDETIVDRIKDWIDRDIEERVAGSEEGAKNDMLYSIDELQYIPGISEEVFQKLLPHVTIFGDGRININSADIYVLMSLKEDITEELAKRVVSYRDVKPFIQTSDIQKVPGYDGPLGTFLMGKITVKGNAFIVSVTSMQEELRRNVTAAVETTGGRFLYRYWREI